MGGYVVFDLVFVFRPPPEAQHEVQSVPLLQLEVAQLLVLAAQLLSTENNALLIGGNALFWFSVGRVVGGVGKQEILQ